jgi:tyrosine-protein kinase Etk/Wzc
MSDQFDPGSDPIPPGYVRIGSAAPVQERHLDDEGGVLNLRELLGSLSRNRWWILLAMVLSAGATGFLLSRQAVRYQANAFIRLRSPEVASALAAVPAKSNDGPKMDPVTSELMVLLGRGVAGEVVDREGLRLVSAVDQTYPSAADSVRITLPAEVMDSVQLTFAADGVTARMQGQVRQARYGMPVEFDQLHFIVTRNPGVESATWRVLPRALAGDLVLAGLQARPRQGTDGIDVSFTAPRPEVATRVVDATVQVYQQVNARTAQQESTRRRIFLHQQLQETDSLFVVTQMALSQFRSTEQAYSTRDKFVGEQSEIMQLDGQRKSLDSDRQLYQSLLRGLSEASGTDVSSRIGALVAAPGISANPVIGQLAQQLGQYERARDSMLVWGRKPEHPEVRQLAVAMGAARSRLEEAVRAQISSIELQRANLDRRRGRSVAELQHLSTTEATELQLVQRVETLRSIGDQLRQEYERARIAEAVEAGQVEIVNLAPGAMPVTGGRAQKLALGLMFGLLVGVGGALFRESSNTSIRRRDDVQRLLRVPGLGVIPRVAPAPRPRARLGRFRNAKPKQASTALASLPQVISPTTGAQEAYRMLRNNILYSRMQKVPRSLVITSTAPGEGKTTTAINLAAALAEQGQRILLVSCDLRRPRLEAQLGVAREPGLTDVLMQRARPADTVLPSGIENLSVLPCGSLDGASVELLGGPRMGLALAWFQQEYDMVILDSPPLLMASETSALAARADAVLLVVRAGQTEHEAAQLAIHQLEMVGARVIGAVLNDPDEAMSRFDRYYGYYGAYASS